MLRTIDKTGKHKRGAREKEADNDEHRAYGEEFIAINETNYIDIALDFPKRYQNVARKARLKEYLRENTKVFYEDTILLDDFSKFIHRISRVGGGAAADDSKVQKNAANTISLPEERVAHFFKEHGHTIPKKEETPQPKRMSIFSRVGLRCSFAWNACQCGGFIHTPKNSSACAKCGNMQHIDTVFCSITVACNIVRAADGTLPLLFFQQQSISHHDLRPIFFARDKRLV